MKSYKLSILTFALLFITFGCADLTEQLGLTTTLPPPPPQEYNNPLSPGTPLPTALKVTNFTALGTDLKSAAATINSNPGAFWGTLDNGLRYTNFSASTSWPSQAMYLKRINFIEPPVNVVQLTEAQFKAYVNTELPKLGMSTAFNSNVNSFVAWVYYRLINNVGNIGWYTDYSQTRPVLGFRDEIQNRMTSIALSTSLSEFEKFVLTQMYNGTLLQAEYAYNNPSPTLQSSGCLPQTKEEWKAVAESAFMTGLGTGVATGVTWAKAGAIATTAAGNPVAGGIIGGGIGFITGFLGGAFLGGGGKLMFQCLWKKAAGQIMTFQCGDKVYSAWTASPPFGCTELAPHAEIPQSIKVGLTSIYEYGVVPNKGAHSIPSSVTTSINDFIKYVNL